MQRTYNDGLEAAAKLLEATATDFEQIITERRAAATRIRPTTEFTAEQKRNERELTEKVRLLRGQAGHIREMKTPEPSLRRV
jgi:L-rhamnose isomerase